MRFKPPQKITITGTQGTVDVTDFFYSSSAKVKNGGATEGLVVTGLVGAGNISTNEKILLKIGRKKFDDHITRIEKGKRPITSAGMGENIGICLRTLTKKEVEQFLYP